MKKIKISEFSNFMIVYYQGHFNGIENERLRMGQAFLNNFYPEEKNPELFYCEDDKVASQMIYDQYVKIDD